MGVKFDINPNIYNEAFKPLVRDDTKMQIIFGGSSSGKSYFAIGQRMIIDLLKGGRNYLGLRNVGRTLRGSIYNEAVAGISSLKADKYFSVNKTDMTITCVNGYQAVLAGLDDVNKLKSIRPAKPGTVFTDILIEEATEIKEDDFKQLERRQRGKVDVRKRIILLFNPIYKTHWIYRRFFSGKWADDDERYQDDNLLIHKTTYKDNQSHLDEDDVKLLEDETNKYWHDVFTLGNWGILGDLVFTNWKVVDLSEIITFDYDKTVERRNNFGTYYNGLDFGYTNDPTAGVRSAIQGTKLFLTHELLYERGLTNDMIAKALKPQINREVIRCDSSEPKSVVELQQHGINAVPALKGPGSVNYGIQYLQQFEILIDKRCQNFINEIELYQWEKDKDGNVLNKAVDKNNHAIDALRYAHDYLIQSRPKYHTKRSLGVF